MKQYVQKLMANGIAVCGGIFLISALSLATALMAQYIYGLEPCNLCLYQRFPYVVAAMLGITGSVMLFRFEGEKWAAITIMMAALTFFTGGIIAFYHVGVEQHWWTSVVAGCTADLSADSAEELLSLLEQKPVVRCDVIPWSDPVIGLSMAGYNAILSFFLAIGCALSSIMVMRKANGVL